MTNKKEGLFQRLLARKLLSSRRFGYDISDREPGPSTADLLTSLTR